MFHIVPSVSFVNRGLSSETDISFFDSKNETRKTFFKILIFKNYKYQLFLQIADMLTEICVDAVLAITPADEKTPLDLHMVELMDMQHRSEQVNIKL